MKGKPDHPFSEKAEPKNDKPFRSPIIDGQIPDKRYSLSLTKKGKLKLSKIPQERKPVAKEAEPRKPCIVKDCSKDCEKCDGIQDDNCVYVIVAKNRGKPSGSSPYVPFPLEDSPRNPETKTKIVILGSCKYAPYEVLLVPNPFDKKLYVEDHEKAYVEACKRFYPAIKNADVVFVYAPDGIGEHTKRDLDYAKSCGKLIVRVSEAEHLKLQEENEQLKAVRDALGKSIKNALADRNRYIKKAEKLQEENEKLTEMLNDNVDVIEDFHEIILAQDERLEAIRKHYENRPNLNIHVTSEENLNLHYTWVQGLGVLLAQPKGLDQKMGEKEKQ